MLSPFLPDANAPEAWMRKPLWRWPNEIPIEGEPSDINELVGNYNQKLVEWDVRKCNFRTDR